MAKKEKEKEKGQGQRNGYLPGIKFYYPAALSAVRATNLSSFFLFSSSLPRGLARVVVVVVVVPVVASEEEEDLWVFVFQLPSSYKLSLPQRSEL